MPSVSVEPLSVYGGDLHISWSDRPISPNAYSHPQPHRADRWLIDSESDSTSRPGPPAGGLLRFLKPTSAWVGIRSFLLGLERNVVPTTGSVAGATVRSPRARLLAPVVVKSLRACASAPIPGWESGGGRSRAYYVTRTGAPRIRFSAAPCFPFPFVFRPLDPERSANASLRAHRVPPQHDIMT